MSQAQKNEGCLGGYLRPQIQFKAADYLKWLYSGGLCETSNSEYRNAPSHCGSLLKNGKPYILSMAIHGSLLCTGSELVL